MGVGFFISVQEKEESIDMKQFQFQKINDDKLVLEHFRFNN
jgi:hypothetical protein